jgi:hypothetical protein
MPYLVYPPNVAPYVLQDEDSTFTLQFACWDWPYFYRSPRDPTIQEVMEREQTMDRPSLFILWARECARRAHIQEQENVARAKRISDAKNKSKYSAATVRQLLSHSFREKKGDREKNRCMDGYGERFEGL